MIDAPPPRVHHRAMPLLFHGQTLLPLPCGGLYWPAEKALLVADLHLEKASHFARKGWPLPPWDSEVTLARLADTLATTGAATLVCLGDSFHDAGGPARMQHAARAALLAIAGACRLVWVTGNHDGSSAATLGGEAVAELRLAGLVLRHEAVPHDASPELSGHFHPKITIHHRGRRISRRCFALSDTKLVLPAYGSLAGGLAIEDIAFADALPGRLTALVAEADRLLRFPVRAAA